VASFLRLEWTRSCGNKRVQKSDLQKSKNWQIPNLEIGEIRSFVGLALWQKSYGYVSANPDESNMNFIHPFWFSLSVCGGFGFFIKFLYLFLGVLLALIRLWRRLRCHRSLVFLKLVTSPIVCVLLVSLLLLRKTSELADFSFLFVVPLLSRSLSLHHFFLWCRFCAHFLE